MTRKELIELFKHELSGRLIDAATFARVEAPLGLYVRTSMQWGDSFLGRVFDALQPKPEPPPPLPAAGNGQQTAGNAPTGADRGQRPETAQPNTGNPAAGPARGQNGQRP